MIFFFFFRNKPNVDPNLVHYFWCDFRYSLCPKLMMIQYPLRDICNLLGIGMSISHWFLYEVRFSGFIFKRTILINNCNIKLQDEKCLFSVLYTFVFTDLTEWFWKWWGQQKKSNNFWTTVPICSTGLYFLLNLAGQLLSIPINYTSSPHLMYLAYLNT